MYRLLHAVHAVLTPQQATEAMHNDMLVIVHNGTTCVHLYVHWGQYHQQHAPTANSLFTLQEARFKQTASGLLHFFGESDLTNLLDQVLHLPLPNEDLITHHLLNNYLEDPNTFVGCCVNCGRGEIFRDHHQLKKKQSNFYRKCGDKETVLPPHISQTLLHFTDLVTL
jgi:hypothetical protein